MQSTSRAENNEERDINDIFSDIFLSENRIFEREFQEGFEQGKQQDNTEAYHLGYHRGAEIGAEIGYYAGVTESYLKYYEKNKTGDERIIRELKNFKDLLATFPRENDLNVDIFQLLSQVKAKFKKLCALLKIHPNFPEPNKLSF